MSLPRRPFYFVRHGESVANVAGLMSGSQWDAPLTPAGEAAAAALAPRLLSLPVARIISSPMLRTKETAMRLNQQAQLPISYDKRLEEIDMGEWTRLPRAEINNRHLRGERPPGGETVAEVQARATAALGEILADDGTPLIVSHGIVQVAIRHAMGMPTERTGNTELLLFSPIPETGWEVVNLSGA